MANAGSGFFPWLNRLDRRWIFLLMALGTIIPIITPIGFPVSTTPPVRAIFERLDSMGPDDVLLISIDYGPTTAPENGPMYSAVLRHALLRDIKVVVIALFPIGGLTEASTIFDQITAEFPEKEYGVDFVNLGYKDGAQAAMRLMSTAMHEVFPLDVDGEPVGNLPLMQGVKSYDDVSAVVSLATGVIGEWWANLVNAQYGTPVAVGCTAVSAPKYYPFVDAGQMFGLMGGLKGASEYERLLLDAYPEIEAAYSDPTVYSAIKGMDVQTIDHLIIIVFIILGNIAYLSQRRART